MSAPEDPDFDRLAAALKATPAPEPFRKAATLADAQAAFQAEFGADARSETPVSQETVAQHRPSDVRRSRRSQRSGGRSMFARLTSPAALTTTGGLLAASVALVVILPQTADGPSFATDPAVTAPAPTQPRALTRDIAVPRDGDTAPLTEAPSAAARGGQGDPTISITGSAAKGLATAPQRVPQPDVFYNRIIEPSAPVHSFGNAVTGPADQPTQAVREADTEAFAEAEPAPVMITSEAPVSTFSVDVDTASWSVIRSSLTAGQLPPPQAVRIEEMVNYFPYSYAAPEGDAPFSTGVSVVQTPWNADTRLVRIGLQGQLPATEVRPPLNLVLLIDTSGSMNAPNKLPLLQRSFRLLLAQLGDQDEVAIVTYAGSAGLALAPTVATERAQIDAALTSLRPGGGTAGQEGLRQAYALAREMSADGEVSRILLATDGDFNIGISDPGDLKSYVARERDGGTYLSVLGFGRGNLDDATMQALAQNGNGTAAYIDTLREARKVLVDQVAGTLVPIANDVKVQVEFNPAAVAEYRLLGYETRALRREDFNNDAVDAGEIGAGHQVTALYEITAPGSPARLNDPLRYQPAPETGGDDAEIGAVRLRWKAPGDDTSQLVETTIPNATQEIDTETAFAAVIAGFGQILTGGTYLGGWSYPQAIALAEANRGSDAFGYRTEAVQLMRDAQALDPGR